VLFWPLTYTSEKNEIEKGRRLDLGPTRLVIETASRWAVEDSCDNLACVRITSSRGALAGTGVEYLCTRSLLRSGFRRSANCFGSTRLRRASSCRSGTPQSGTSFTVAGPGDDITILFARRQVQRGQSLFSVQCGFCHGRDAAGGEAGLDLTSSELVAKDIRGNEIGPVVRAGRIDKGMPLFNVNDVDLAAIVAFIHDQKIKITSKEGRRRTVQIEDLQTGSAEHGKEYFNGAGGCSKCHSPSADLAGIGEAGLRGLALLHRMLYPGGAVALVLLQPQQRSR